MNSLATTEITTSSEKKGAERFDSLDALAALVLTAAIPLRLFFFSGFGLGDDANESAALINFASNLRFDPNDFAHYRVTNILLRGVPYALFGVNELSFLAPVFLIALATNVVTVLLARKLFGSRGGLITAAIILSTPFETLAATANVPDYFHGFGITMCSYFLVLFLERGAARYSLYSVLWFGFALLNRLSTLLFLPVVALATLLTFHSRAAWRMWWEMTALLFLLISLGDYFYSGSLLRWFFFNSGGGGVNVTDVLGYVLRVYPRYLLIWDDNGNFMFGLTGWCALIGGVIGIYRLVRGRATPGERLAIRCTIAYLFLFEFMPHRLTLEGYYSHPRIFRYLAQITPNIYLAATYGVLQVRESWLRRRPRLSYATALLAGIFGLSQIPAVTLPLRDASSDIRTVVNFLQPTNVGEGFVITADYWRCGIISSLLFPSYLANKLNCISPDNDAKKAQMLHDAPPGIIITGGASLPWYSGIDLIVSLSRINYRPPPTWDLIFENREPVRPWREEPLRIWKKRTMTSGEESPPTPSPMQ